MTVLPSPAELLWGALVFAILVAGLIAVTVIVARRSSSARTGELETWREPALKAEAKRDLLRELMDDNPRRAPD